MTFVSYAQNFEDVLLWRCFGHLKSGFYVDIGADDPINDSVTKSFYDVGWSGINIEPSENSFRKLQADRKRDINLQVAAGIQDGIIDFWNIPKTGLSTGVKKYADQHKSAGFEVNSASVQTKSLKEICEEFVTSPINFMKIDVEGYEKQVLLGADFEKFRPMVIVIESTEPNSQVENYYEWEYILLGKKYQFCYSDGLNRFYLSEESADLALHFKFPPNVFDQFVLSANWRVYDPKSKNVENSDEVNNHESIVASDIFTEHEKKRILMTISCADSELIPKVASAGKIININGDDIQLMHNGIKIVEGCYYGPWMTKIIEILRGHHEPQEEFAFFKLIDHLHKNPSPWGNPRMIELGSFWAYYSMWFLKEFPAGSSYCFEPDPNYLETGKKNFLLNDLSGEFFHAMVSNHSAEIREFQCESDGQVIEVPTLDFIGIITATNQKEIDIVLVDIQGAETPLLSGLSEVLQSFTIRFMVISTHDFAISGSPITHQSALDLLIQNGAHIILEHSVSESYSGDGFILASFLEVDKTLRIPISYNRSKDSLFGEWEPRMNELQINLTHQRDELTHQRDELTHQRDELTHQRDMIMNSSIWKLTKPIRGFVNFLKTKN